MKETSNKKQSPPKEVIKENTFPVVAIGASAGGLEAMMELLKYLPANTGMAFIYVQHLSPDHKSMLTEILSKKTKMIVQEIDDMDKIKPDNVFVIPYNKGIEVTDGHIKLIPRSETSAAITIDILFSTLAEAQNERVIGIVLSGSASDGAMGIKAIKQHGGLTFAQDDTAKFMSMPHSAIATGAVDFILSPKEIALELERLSKHPLIKTIGVKNGEEDLIDNSDPDLKTILNQLHKATGVDFSAYKMNTIKRRIIRRMLLYKIITLREYAKMLTQKNEEIDILYQDLLINVTSFFRDTDTHQYLKTTLFPKMLKRKKTGESLRIWVPACATGEEAYSIAMMLLEIQGSQTTSIPVQIFATDLSAQAIGRARSGLYTKKELETVSPKRIQRFFTKDNGSFRVNKAVRDMCVFAPHNILLDPPFSRLDFISCCNLFIYFDNAAQKKAVNTFHYALNDDGFLMLGKSENISHSTSLFTGFNKKYKIFSRKINSGNRTLPALSPRYSKQTLVEKNIPATSKNKTPKNTSVHYDGLDNAIDAVLIAEFMPASVVINHQMEIVQFRGTTDLFLTHPKGKATFNILKMARPEIAFELRNAISKVIKSKHRFRKSGIEIKVNSDVRSISVEVVPLKIASDEPLILILFNELEQTEMFSQNSEGGKNNSLAKDRRIKKLEQELAAAHADALAIAQEHEAFTEELQSANEEVVSSNEELQTVNEELETSKEEIESSNEELTTTNQELQTRNDLLNEAYGFSEAVFATIHEPMLVLDKNFRVKSANKTFYKIFKVKEEETEGSFLFELGNKQWNIPSLREFLQEVVPKNNHFHGFEVSHNFPQIGEKIMLLNASRIIQKRHGEELILLSISDVTEQSTSRRKIEDSEKRYNMMLMKSPFAFAVLKGKNMVITLANNSIKEMWGKGKDLEGKPLIKVLPELKDSEFPGLLDKVYTTGKPFYGDEMLAPVFRNGKLVDVYFNFVYQPYLEADETISGVTIIAIEVTNEVIAKQKIKDSQQQLQNIFMQAPFALNIYEGKEFVISLANKLFCEIIGKTESEILGKKLFDVFPETATQGLDKILSDIFSTGIPFKGNEFPVHFLKHGNEFKGYFDFIYQPIFDYNKNVSGVINVAIDVTDKVLARKKIEESDKRYNLMLMHSPFTFAVLKGKDLVIDLANDQIKKVWGVGNEIEGKSLLEIMPDLKNTTFPALLDEVRATGIPFHGIEVQSPKSLHGDLKEEYFFNFVFQPYLEADHTISGITIIGSDVTEQVIAKRKVEESELKFKLLTNSMPQKITNTDKDGNVIFFNKQWLDDTGLTFEELRDWGWEKAMHPDDLEPTLNNWKHSVATGEVFDLECRIQNKEGDYRWHLSRALPIKDETGKILMWVGSNTDIHELKEAKNKAEEVTKAKQQFLSNMSHEIRTPLNSILGFTNVLLKTELGREQKEFLNAIQLSGTSLNALINDILDLAKVDAGKMTFEKQSFEIRKSISAILHLFDLKIKEKNLELITEFDSEIPSILLGDSIRLNQVILNLMSNSVKFTHKGKIVLTVKLINQDENNVTVEFTVTDSGIGIPANKINSIFNLFEQAEIGTANSYGGTGLGLAIVKQLIEAQGGSVSLKSKIGEGSTFSFVLAFAKSNLKPAEEIEILNPELSINKLRVLVAEDVALNQLLIKIILSDYGFEFDIVDNGKTAIEKLIMNSYDIILMDLQMPEMNGFESTDYIRKTMNSSIPIIALTADVTTVDIEKCKNFGMDDYVSKPINEKILYNKILELVKRNQ